jgi:DMSO/TMAO reductase YedYZ heme-binding membrane subunit
MQKKESLSWTRTNLFSLILFLVVFAYAVIRYNVIKGVPWAQLPLFISNKGIALASVVFIALSFILGPLTKFWPQTFARFQPLRKYFGLLGFGLGAIHAVMSLLIFSPAYYPKFFTQTGNLNLIGELSMLFGVLGFFIFLIVALTSIGAIQKTMRYETWLTVQRTGYLAFFFILLHVFVMGFEGWQKPETWPGGLLPISLVAFIIIAVTLLIRVIAIITPSKK